MNNKMKVNLKTDSLDFKENLMKIIEALKDSTFKPNFTEISKKTGIPVSTIFQRWSVITKLLNVDCELTITKKGYKKKSNI